MNPPRLLGRSCYTDGEMPEQYSEFPATNALRAFVDCYWRSTSCQSASRILPDGCIDLIVDGTSKEARLVGSMSRARLRSRRTDELIGARFKPGGAKVLLRVDPEELVDEVVTWRFSSALELARPGSAISTGQLDDWLTKQLSGISTEDQRDAVLSQICMQQAHEPIASLAVKLGTTRQRLRRRTLLATGLRPKQLQRISRLQRVTIALLGSDSSIASAASQAGYYDQAHLSNEFAALAGTTVKKYLRERAVPFFQDV